jgi:hypothetical protein
MKGADKPKMLWSSPGAGGAWLTDERPRMLIGEGIETTLSALVAHDGDANTGAVAALSTSGMGKLVPPDAVREIVILVDVDDPDPKTGVRPGEAAARKFADRMAADGRTVRLAFPGARDGAKCDFNDLLRREGPEAVRKAIEAAEVVPDPNAARRARAPEAVLEEAFALREEGSRLPRPVRRMSERPELPADLTLAEGEARLAALMRETVQAGMYAAAPVGIKAAARMRARADMRALPMRDPRRIPGPERKAYLAERRSAHACEMKAALADAGWPSIAPTLAPLVVNATTGLGKTEAAIRALAAILRDAPVPVPVTWLATGYKQVDEAAARLKAAGVQVRVLRGRDQADPETGEPLCQRVELAKQVAESGLSVSGTLCASKADECPFRATCRYFKQAEDIPDGTVRIATHDALARDTLPGGVKLGGLVIVDESPLRVLAGERQMREGTVEEIRALAARTDGVWPAVASVSREAAALLGVPDLGGAEWCQRLEACGVSRDELNGAKALLAEALKAPGDVGRPSDDEPTLRAAVRHAGAEARALKQALAVVGALAQDCGFPGRPVQSLMALVPEIKDVARWRAFSAVPALPEGISLIVLDGTSDPDVSKLLFGPATRFETIRVAQHMSVTQIVDPSFSKTALGIAHDLHAAAAQATADGKHDAAAKHANAARLADDRRRESLDVAVGLGKRQGPGKMAVVTYKTLAQTSEWTAAAADHSLRLAWFGGMRGLDAMADCTAVAVFGRPQPPRLTIEDIARVLHARDPVPLTGLALANAPAEERQFTKMPRALLLPGCDAWGMEVDAHPDPRVDAVLRMVRDAELIQAIGRIRAARAGKDSPKAVYLFCDVPLPLAVDRVATLDEIMRGLAVADEARREGLPLDARTLFVRVPNAMEGKGGRALGDSRKMDLARRVRADVVAKAVVFRRTAEGVQYLYCIYSYGETGPLPRVCGFITKNDYEVHMALIYGDLPQSLEEFRSAIGQPDVLEWVPDVGRKVVMAMDARMKAQDDWHRAGARLHQVSMSAPQPYRSGWSGVAAWMKDERDASCAWFCAWERYADASPAAERAAIRQEMEDFARNEAEAARIELAGSNLVLLDRLDPFVIETPDGLRLRLALPDGRTFQDTSVDAEIFCRSWLRTRQYMPAEVHARPFARLFEDFRQMDSAGQAAAASVMVHA